MKGWALRPLCPGDAPERPAVGGDNRQALSQVSPRVVDLAGLEPAASSLSEIDGRALCYPAFPLVVPIRNCHRDGGELRTSRWWAGPVVGRRLVCGPWREGRQTGVQAP